MARRPAKKRGKNKRPAPGSGRGKPKVSKRARRVAHGFVAASEAPETSVRGGIEDAPTEGVRLNRWLAEQGVDSRRKCDEKIFDGEVTVNGSVVDTPGYRVQEGDEVAVNGQRIRTGRRLYYLFYKPRGVLCTNDPRETRTRLCDLVDPMVPSRVYPVGRLDEDSEGLILLTNDGDFSNLIAHPRFGIEKNYVCQVNNSMTGEDLTRLRGGAYIDGVKVVPSNVRIMRKSPKSTLMEISIHEGRNREIRRLLARFGLNVKRLKRVRIGHLGVAGVKRGMLRPLSREERDRLVEMARAGEEEGAEYRKFTPRSGRGSGPKKGGAKRGPRGGSEGRGDSGPRGGKPRGKAQGGGAKPSRKKRGGSPFA